MKKDHLVVTIVPSEKASGPESHGCPCLDLSGLFANREREPLLALITGETGAGKSTWCLELIHQARQVGIRVSGLVAAPVTDQGRRVAIDLVNVASTERRRLAVFRPGARQKTVGNLAISTLNWVFDPDVFAWGNRALAEIDECELLVLDELGPLELVRNNGLTAGVQLVDAQRYQTACVVVRPTMLPAALERWPCAKVLRVTGGLPSDAATDRQ